MSCKMSSEFYNVAFRSVIFFAVQKLQNGIILTNFMAAEVVVVIMMIVMMNFRFLVQ
jgi:hypothetical protein